MPPTTAQSTRRATQFAGIALLAAALIPAAGCIRSKVTITSEPSQAEVFFQGRPRGLTPITIPFNWYWHYDIRLEKEDFDSVEVIERFRSPPWFMLPFDLFLEVVPIPIIDHRSRHYILEPEEQSPLRSSTIGSP